MPFWEFLIFPAVAMIFFALALWLCSRTTRLLAECKEYMDSLDA